MKVARRKHLDVQQVGRNIRRFSIPASPDGYPSLTLGRAKLRDDFSVFSLRDGESDGRWVCREVVWNLRAMSGGKERKQEELRRRYNDAVAADRRCRSRTRRGGGRQILRRPFQLAASLSRHPPLVVGNPRQHSAVTRAVRNPRGPLPFLGVASTFLGAWRERSRCRWSPDIPDISRQKSRSSFLDRDYTLGRFHLTDRRGSLNFFYIFLQL